MKRRTLAAALLALCLAFSACAGGNPDAPTEKERQTDMDAEREAAQAASEAAEAAMAAAQEAEPAAESRQSLRVSAASPERLLYRDDTEIVYTVETPADCAEVVLSLLYRPYGVRLQLRSFTPQERQEFEAMDSAVLWAYNAPLSQLRFTPDSEGVSVAARDGTLVWTIPCDFGFTGAERVAAEAVRPGDNEGMHLFGVVTVDIRYPRYNIVDEVETAIRAAVAYNRDEPLYFVCDLRETSVDFEALDPSRVAHAALFGLDRVVWQYSEDVMALEETLGTQYGVYWDYALRDPDVYGGSMYMRVPYYAQIETTPCANSEQGSERIPLSGLYVPEGEGVLLCGIRLVNEDPLLPGADPAWLDSYIDPDIRAILCHQAGVEANAEDFPSAAVVQSGAEAVVAECIQPGMTDFEKAKALFDWMYERGKNAELPAGFNSLSESRQNLYYKTAYGFMTEGFGDCMGWSGTFTVLCRMAGLRCFGVDCATEPGGATLEPYKATHRINALWLDGEMYYADTFWGAAGSGYEKPQYTYFLMTTAQAAETYTWNARLDIPETAATKYAVDPETGALRASLTTGSP